VAEVRAHHASARSCAPPERVPVKSFFQGQEYLYRLVKMLAGGG
jgi:hypothetical protein